MKHLFKTHLFLYAFLLFSVFCSITGCVQKEKDESTFFTEQLDISEDKDFEENNLLLWDNPSLKELNPNLYSICNENFNGKPYNNLTAFGKKLLLVGEAFYGTEEEYQSYENPSDIPTQFSFDLYNPFTNTIEYELPYDQISCDAYAVIDELLYLYEEASGKISVYDNTLSLIDSISTSRNMNSWELAIFEQKGVSFDCIPSSYVKLSTCTTDFIMLTYINENQQFCEAILDRFTGQILQSFLSSDSNHSNGNGAYYVKQTSSLESIWAYGTINQTPQYFSYPDVRQAYPLEDGAMILRKESYDYTLSDYPITYIYVAPNRSFSDSFTFSCGEIGEATARYLSSSIVINEELNACFLISYDATLTPSLLVWNYEKNNNGLRYLPLKSSEEALSLDLLKVSSLTDEGYRDARLFADSLEETYGIKIFLGDEVPAQLSTYQFTRLPSYKDTKESLKLLDYALSLYPEGFFQKLCYGNNHNLEIYLSGPMASDSSDMLHSPNGFSIEYGSNTLIVLDATNYAHWDYTLHHELSHVIDTKLLFLNQYSLGCSFTENTWNSFNPDDFCYADSYTDYKKLFLDEYRGEYFIDSYGISFATEDRAEIFGRIMQCYQNQTWSKVPFAAESKLYQKYEYYCTSIREGFDYSTEELNWEFLIEK